MNKLYDSSRANLTDIAFFLKIEANLLAKILIIFLLIFNKIDRRSLHLSGT